MERILDVYKREYNEDNPVVCMDESPKQLISSARPDLKMKPGSDQKTDYEYIRHGMVNVFMVNEPLAGRRHVEVTDTKTKKDWAKLIKKISDEMYPEASKITLVMDNYGTHNASALYETYAPEEAKRLWDRFEFVYTPKHGSWLNMAEIKLNVLNSQCLARHIDTKEEIEEQVKAWQKYRNIKDCKINWQFTTKESRVKLKRLYPSYHD